jgi:hypothetical protein
MDTGYCAGQIADFKEELAVRIDDLKVERREAGESNAGMVRVARF